MTNGLFIFHRDLRFKDNISLNLLNKKVDKLFCCFIFTPEQVSSINKYRSMNSIQFMLDSLYDLENMIKDKGGEILFFYGSTINILGQLINDLNIDILACNKDYTPYAKERLKKIEDLCKKNKIELIAENDYYLYEPGSIIVDASKKAYTKFTPFYNKLKTIKYEKPVKTVNIKFSKLGNQEFIKKILVNLQDVEKKILKKRNPDLLSIGSRNNGLKILSSINNNKFKNYDKNRDYLDKLNSGTTLISPFLKFGCISVRETAEIFKKVTALYRQLIWREFYAHILNDFPYVLGRPLKQQYSGLRWSSSKSLFDAWTKGETGFPIVDAGMREMNKTGYMHNRSRLIVASFLIKTLLIDWKKGEHYFATQLLDYDVASNNGNWQWVASTGADSQPYFRIFNPWSQGEKHDPDCVYIKKWIPELKDIPSKDIHKWEEVCEDYIKNKKIKYFKPIVNYSEQRMKALEMYKNVLS